jgi:hypothetical protein
VEERRGEQLDKVNGFSERKYYLKMYLLTDNKETRQTKEKNLTMNLPLGLINK